MAIKFRTNVRKALEVILWFANKRPGIDFHAILKLLFFADKYHLNQWGRPIIGDRYEAGPYGPVAQTTYDILRGDPLVYELLQLQQLPFAVTERYRVTANRAPDLDKLSESDIEALDEAWREYSHMDFTNLTDASHEDPAYRKAELEGRRDMLYADFLEGANASAEVLADLEITAPRMRI
jgi:uncharacterized phage-associated protein